MITSVTYKLKIFCTLFMPSFQLLFLAVKHWSRSQDFARFVSFDAGRPWRWVRHESLLSKSVRAVENNDVHPRNKQFPWIGILLRDIFDSLSIYILFAQCTDSPRKALLPQRLHFSNCWESNRFSAKAKAILLEKSNRSSQNSAVMVCWNWFRIWNMRHVHLLGTFSCCSFSSSSDPEITIFSVFGVWCQNCPKGSASFETKSSRRWT